MVDLPSLTVQIKILPLLQGQVILPLVDAEHPTIRLMRNAQGQGKLGDARTRSPSRSSCRRSTT